MVKPREGESEYAAIVRELEQKREEWDLAKAGATTDQQRADVDKRYGENIKLMEKEREDIRAAKPGQAKLHESSASDKEKTAKDREPG